MRRLLPAIFAITMPLIIGCPAPCEPLKATISIDSQLPSAESEAPVPSSPAPEQWQLDAAETRRLLRQQAGLQEEERMRALQSQAAAADNQSPSPRTWMRGRVYTNDSLVGTYCIINPLLPIPFPSAMPEYGITDVRLHPGFLASWWGYKPPNPCIATMVPYGPRGNYKFWHSDPNGPAGYVENIGSNKLGFVKIRYWFVDRNQDGAEGFFRGTALEEQRQLQLRLFRSGTVNPDSGNTVTTIPLY